MKYKLNMSNSYYPQENRTDIKNQPQAIPTKQNPIACSNVYTFFI